MERERCPSSTRHIIAATAKSLVDRPVDTILKAIIFFIFQEFF